MVSLYTVPFEKNIFQFTSATQYEILHHPASDQQ